MRALLAVVVALLALPVSAAADTVVVAGPERDSDPLAVNGIWVHELDRSAGGNPARLAAQARGNGMRTVIVKAAQGTYTWPQFTKRLVDVLHAAGLNVCGYQRVESFGGAAQARTFAKAVAKGADCLVIDAEAELEHRRGASVAKAYMQTLRSAVGSRYPVGMTSFPYTSFHKPFPYRAFLEGEGAAQVNMPQVYWRLLDDPPVQSLRRAWRENEQFGAPIHVIGQLFDRPPAPEIRAFRREAERLGAHGVSWWVFQLAGPDAWRAVRSPL